MSDVMRTPAPVGPERYAARVLGAARGHDNRADGGSVRRGMGARMALAAWSVAIIVCVVAVAIGYGPPAGRRWLLFSGALALIAAVQSAISDPRDLTLAYLFSLPAIVALIAHGSPTWLIGPFAALLLLAGELCTLGWECQNRGAAAALKRTRLANIALLCALALVASVVVGIVSGVW